MVWATMRKKIFKEIKQRMTQQHSGPREYHAK